ncbi:PEGA domain-containing protein [Turneriella parva]|uniref:PEGA domain protein n=1 Tax=Turneriella parva (strain ATCC BAA-1111 / DSM 21527 / NCTC 11395 / H) TaxID=869212 RepID=I4B8W6_TURPD|nr:PEGA domain-containing protein [Turneriella parva]AFM13723.1 PEGA domain protein [Turneriella parva DSM 21527]
MFRLTAFAAFMAALGVSPLAAQKQQKTVAVVNFVNSAGQPGLNYLKTALPESISGSLSASREVRVVERSGLTNILKEIELEQSGVVNTGEVARAGKLARADVLLMGSFSGNPERITVTLKAVDVATGVVLEGRSVSAPLSDILEQCGQTSLAMAAAIAGGKTGLLTVTSAPDGAEVLVDGIVAGKTPLVEYKVTAGQHTLFVRKSGYQEAEKNVTIRAGATERISETLAPARESVQMFMGFGYQRVFPSAAALQAGNLFSGQLGVNFGRWTADIAFAFNNSWNHTYTYATPFGTLSQKREYTLSSFLLGIAVEPFSLGQYVSPYVGVFGGYTIVNDYRFKGSDDERERVASYDLLQLGVKAGIEIMPKLSVSLFLEGRYNAFTSAIQRSTFVSQGILGEPTSTTSDLNLTNFSIGGGARLNF